MWNRSAPVVLKLWRNDCMNTAIFALILIQQYWTRSTLSGVTTMVTGCLGVGNHAELELQKGCIRRNLTEPEEFFHRYLWRQRFEVTRAARLVWDFATFDDLTHTKLLSSSNSRVKTDTKRRLAGAVIDQVPRKLAHMLLGLRMWKQT